MSFIGGPRLRTEAYVSPSHLQLLSKLDSCGRDSTKECMSPLACYQTTENAVYDINKRTQQICFVDYFETLSVASLHNSAEW
jgi:hypothetical protein